MENIIIMGYSGHSYVVIDILKQQGYNIKGYFDRLPTSVNPFDLKYLGDENLDESIQKIRNNKFLVAIGDNNIRRKVFDKMLYNELTSLNAIHPKAIIGHSVTMGTGNMVMAGAVINALCSVGNAVIINSGAIVEHECVIGDYSHIAPGAVLAGKVKVGCSSFIGANSVVKEGVTIGDNVIIGAGSIVIRDIPDGETVVGNPAKKIK